MFVKGGERSFSLLLDSAMIMDLVQVRVQNPEVHLLLHFVLFALNQMGKVAFVAVL